MQPGPVFGLMVTSALSASGWDRNRPIGNIAWAWLALLVTPSILAFALVFSGQALTTERPVNDAPAVVVAYADNEKATAVGASFRLDDGRLRAWAYTVFRNGSAFSAGETPAYSEEWLVFDCRDESVRVHHAKYYRPNADPFRPAPIPSGFEPVEGNVLRQHQLDVACGTAARPQYSDYFRFMEAYGLNDGRTPRSPPGPLVR